MDLSWNLQNVGDIIQIDVLVILVACQASNGTCRPR
jgi:hypothetical protein